MPKAYTNKTCEQNLRRKMFGLMMRIVRLKINSGVVSWRFVFMSFLALRSESNSRTWVSASSIPVSLMNELMNVARIDVWFGRSKLEVETAKLIIFCSLEHLRENSTNVSCDSYISVIKWPYCQAIHLSLHLLCMKERRVKKRHEWEIWREKEELYSLYFFSYVHLYRELHVSCITFADNVFQLASTFDLTL